MWKVSGSSWHQVGRLLTSSTAAQGQYMLLEPEGNIPWGFDDEQGPRPRLGYPKMNATSSEINLGDLDNYEERTQPSRELFDDLSLVLARTMSQMPQLRLLLYRMDNLHDDIYNWFGFSCLHFRVGDVVREWDQLTSWDCGIIADEPRTRIDWIFTCSAAQLLGWQMSDESREMLYKRW